MFAFIDKKLAKINLYYVIPSIYIIHLLPFHVIEKIKMNLSRNKEHKMEQSNQIEECLIFPKLIIDLQKYLESRVTFNPLSPQGMMIFGMITSLYKVYPLKKLF